MTYKFETPPQEWPDYRDLCIAVLNDVITREYYCSCSLPIKFPGHFLVQICSHHGRDILRELLYRILCW
jgi:hypothetical protein